MAGIEEIIRQQLSAERIASDPKIAGILGSILNKATGQDRRT